MLAQDCPGLNSVRTVCCMGKRPRWSPQKPIVDEVPFCKKVTNVTWMVVPFPPMIALNCTTLTAPLTLEDVPVTAPRTKTFPHPARATTRQATRERQKGPFTDHLGTKIGQSLHPAAAAWHASSRKKTRLGNRLNSALDGTRIIVSFCCLPYFLPKFLAPTSGFGRERKDAHARIILRQDSERIS